MIVSTSTIMLLVFMNAFQPFLLTEIYDIADDDYGKISGSLTLADEIWSFCFLGIWGLVSDYLSRRLVVCIGFFTSGFALYLFPHGNTIFPGLLLIRLIFAQGSAGLAAMLTALLSDIVHPSSLGIGAGFLAITSGTGALLGGICSCWGNSIIGLYSAYLLYCWNDIYTYRYYIMDFSSEIYTAISLDEKVSTKVSEKVVNSLKLLKTQPDLIVSYLGGFTARSGAVVVTSYIALWIARHFSENNLCSSSEDDVTHSNQCGQFVDSNPEKRTCPSAFTASSRVSGTAQTAALLGSFLIGFIAHKMKNKIRIGLVYVALFGTISYALALVISDPTESLIYLVASLWGLAEISMIVFVQVLIAQEMKYHPNIKGTIAGTFSMCGSLGIIVVTNIGGALFDIWIPQAPFVVMSIISFLLAMASFLIPKSKHDNQILI